MCDRLCGAAACRPTYPLQSAWSGTFCRHLFSEFFNHFYWVVHEVPHTLRQSAELSKPKMLVLLCIPELVKSSLFTRVSLQSSVFTFPTRNNLYTGLIITLGNCKTTAIATFKQTAVSVSKIYQKVWKRWVNTNFLYVYQCFWTCHFYIQWN